VTLAEWKLKVENRIVTKPIAKKKKKKKKLHRAPGALDPVV